MRPRPRQQLVTQTQVVKRSPYRNTTRAQTPPPIPGRVHADIQTTEIQLEEITENVVTFDSHTQTDPLLDRPPTPMFVPFKTGRDAETQIQAGELFDFDEEVAPLVEVVVGKTLEQAMLEVLQEEELDLLRQQQVAFQQRRLEEAIETEGLAAEERRRFEEQQRRKKQEQERVHQEKVTRERLAARLYAKQFLGTLTNHVFGKLEDAGWLCPEVDGEVEMEFMPWLLDRSVEELGVRDTAHQMVNDLIREALAERAR